MAALSCPNPPPIFTIFFLSPFLLFLSFFLVSTYYTQNQYHHVNTSHLNQVINPINHQSPQQLIIPSSSSIHNLSNEFYIPTETIATHEESTKERSSSLNRIEDGLARARYAIRQATRDSRRGTHNHNTSVEQDQGDNIGDGFILQGSSIYRNPVAFQQSHIEMEKRLKIWTYSEGEQPLFHDGPVNSIYSTEGQFISEMESTKSPFMAKSPDEANVFFLPFSVHRVLRFIYKPESKRSFSPERLQRIVKDYVHVISNKYPYWNRSSGADHFMVSCHDWGPQISGSDPELFRNLIRVLCNANTSEGFKPYRDVSLPEINLPFGRLTVPHLELPLPNRSILAFFAGRVHGKIRKILLKHWKEKDEEVQVYETLPKGLNYVKLMGKSRFCLCPSGWEVASPRVVEAIFAGCVPVILSKYYILPFSDVLDWNQFSVQISVNQIPKIKQILKNMSMDRYQKLQRRLEQVRRHFEVNRPAKRFDLIHMVLHSVWLRRLNIGLQY